MCSRAREIVFNIVIHLTEWKQQHKRKRYVAQDTNDATGVLESQVKYITFGRRQSEARGRLIFFTSSEIMRMKMKDKTFHWIYIVHYKYKIY